jgi:hypothetical protein
MAELAGPLRVMKIAIQTAKIAYPDYERRAALNGRISTLIRQRLSCSRLRALSHEPFLLVITRLSVSAGSNDSNTLADRFRAVRPPLLVRCDNAGRTYDRRPPAVHRRNKNACQGAVHI